MKNSKKVFKTYRKFIESEYSDLLDTIQYAIDYAATTGRTKAKVYVELVDLLKDGFVVDIHSYLEYFGYSVSIEDYVIHNDTSRDDIDIIPYESKALVETLKNQDRSKGGLIIIDFSCLEK